MPKLIFIIGPQAVGKMTIGKLLASETGLKFFHNHISIELALGFYEYGTSGFWKINNGIRKLIFDTISEYEDKGLIFTYVWDFNDPQEEKYIKNIINKINVNKSWEIYFIELEANLEIRLKRNIQPDRIEAKPSKQDTVRTTEELKSSSRKYKLNSEGSFPLNYSHIVINNEKTLPLKVVTQILKFCGLNY